MMHETYFGLRKRPFLATPTLDRYCPIECQETAYASVTRAIHRCEGPVTIIGGTGLGKTMVSLRIADAFRRSFEVIVLASSQLCSRRALLQSLLFELRMPYRDLSEGELRLSLLERLQPSNDNPTDGLVLIVDEAQTLAPKLLEELRLITNLTREGVPRVRLVLCGTSRLEEMLGHPQMESLNQRLAARCYLMPLNAQETIRYLTHKIELCGAPISAVITEEAMRLVHRASDGVPRLIDHTVDAALRLAADMRQRPISASIIEAAWAQSQQLPLPWSDNSQSISSSSPSIEFGLLEEDTEQDFQARDTSYVHRTSLPNDDLELINPMPSTYGPTSSVSNYWNGEQIASSEMDSYRSEPLASDQRYQSDETVDPEVAYYQESIGLTPNPPASPVPSAGSGLSRSITNAWDAFMETNEPAQEVPPASPVSASDVFGADFDEEQWLPDVPAIDLPSKGNSIRTNPTAWSGQQPLTIPEDVVYPSHKYERANLDPSNFQMPAIDDVPIEIISDDMVDHSLYAFRDAQTAAMQNATMEKSALDQSAADAIELLDEISSSNLEAMTMDPSDTVADASVAPPEPIHNHSQVASNGRVVRTPRTPAGVSPKTSNAKLARPPRASILSFADLQQDSIDVLQDDRDLLIIEEDVLHMTAGMPTATVQDAVSHATVHPYKQLFSKLRG